MKLSECKIGDIVVVNDNVVPLFNNYIGERGKIIKLMANGMLILKFENNKKFICHISPEDNEVGGFWAGELDNAK